MDIHAVCRICLEYLQNDKSYDLFLVPRLAKKLYVCTSLSVEPQDGFPKNICGVCYTRLSDLADFQKLCVDSVQKFQEFLTNNGIVCVPTFDMDASATAPIEDVQMLETVDKEGVEMPTKVTEEISDDSGDNDGDEDFQFPDIGERCDNDDDSDSDNDKPLASRIRSFKEEPPVTAPIEDVQMPEDEDGHLNFDPLFTNHKMEMLENEYGVKMPENEVEFKMLGTADKDVEEVPTKVAKEISDDSSDNDRDSDEDFQLSDIGESCNSDDDSDIDDDKPLASRIRSIAKEIKENEKPQTDNKDPKIKPKRKRIPAAELHLYRIIECHICHQKFKKTNTYEKHMKYHNDKLPFQCEVENCKCYFTTARALRVHTFKHTGRGLPFTCNICGKRFKFNRALKDHLMRHADTRGRKFKCQYCGKQFDRSTCCQMHEMTHTGETRYECKVCGQCFKFAHCLTRHLITHVKRVLLAIEVYRKRQIELGEVLADDAEPIPELPNPTQESHQKVADKILKVWAHFVKSIPKDARRVADIAVNPIPRVVPKIKMKMMEGKYTCPHCRQGFNSARSLRIHHKSVHQCRYCHKGFATARNLKYHEMRHTGEKPHACSLCDKRFIQYFALKRHMKVHQKRPTYRRNEALANMPKAIPKERLLPGADISIATSVLPSDLVNATYAATTSTTNAENTEDSTSDSVFKIEIQENDMFYSGVMDN